MDSKCYQYSSISGSQLGYDKFLDSALNGLGMLSTVTNSRLEYLKEQQDIECLKENMKKKCCSSSLSTPLCVVYKNSDFVTEFSLSKKPSPVMHFPISDDLKQRRVKRSNKIKRIHYAPYFFKKGILPTKLEEERALRECKPKITDENPASPPMISRQDSGNKSNPSSPVKSQNSPTFVGCSIFRSRSLDDLEITKLNNLSETPDLLSHVEIDTMSQRISELHVS